MAGTGGETESSYQGGFASGSGSMGLSSVPGVSRGGKVAFQVEKEVDSTDSINIFSSAADSASAKASFESPTSFVLSNIGNAGLGLSLKIPYWSDDTTVSTSRYIQIFLGKGESIDLATTRLVETLNSGFNSGTQVASFTAPGTNLYVDSTADTTEGFADGDDTTITFDDGSGGVAHHMFRVNDLIRLDNEICRIKSIVDTAGDGDFTPAHFIVDRGVHGSTKADHTNNTNISFAFFNTANGRPFSKDSVVHTDEMGSYSSTNFFGLGRSTTIANSGIVPGSACFIFYSKPYQEMGCVGLTSNSNSGLISGEIYYIKVAVNGGTEYEVGFTVDSVYLGGTTGILQKIQDALNTQYHTTASVLNGKRISVGIFGGDIRWVFDERKSGSTIALTAGTTGDSSHDLVANALGVFPASVKPAITTSLPGTEVSGGIGYENKPNVGSMLYDDGRGNLLAPFGGGRINYESGAITINTGYRNAQFQYVVAHSSTFAGRASSSKSNIVEEIYATSTSPAMTSKVRLEVSV